MSKYLILICLIFCGHYIYAQEYNLIDFEYQIAPNANSDVEIGTIAIDGNIPFQLNKGKLINVLGIAQYKFTYNENFVFATEEIESFYKIKYGWLYAYPISKSWNVTVGAGLDLASNFEDKLSSEDLFYNGTLKFSKKFNTSTKDARLSFGIMYSGILGKQQLLPIVSYKQKINERIAFGLGFPETYLKYDITTQSELKANLDIDGLTANLSNTIPLDLNTNTVTNTRISTVGVSLIYAHKFDKYWTVYGTLGHSLYNQYELVDDDGVKYELDIAPQLYFSTGIRFNINNK